MENKNNYVIPQCNVVEIKEEDIVRASEQIVPSTSNNGFVGGDDNFLP